MGLDSRRSATQKGEERSRECGHHASVQSIILESSFATSSVLGGVRATAFSNPSSCIFPAVSYRDIAGASENEESPDKCFPEMVLNLEEKGYWSGLGAHPSSYKSLVTGSA